MQSNGGYDNDNSILHYIELKPKICLKNEFITH